MVELYSLQESDAVRQLSALTTDLKEMARTGAGRLTFLDAKNLPLGNQVGILDSNIGMPPNNILFDLQFLFPLAADDFGGCSTVVGTLLYEYKKFGKPQFSRQPIAPGQLVRPDTEIGYERKFFADSAEARQIKTELERLLTELEVRKTVDK